MNWLERVRELIREHGSVVRAVIFEAQGATPRETGAAMLVTAATHEGTIGGGALELDAIAAARSLIPGSSGRNAKWSRQVREYPLGPVLGQRCGGNVRLLFEVLGSLPPAVRDAVGDIGKDDRVSIELVTAGTADEVWLVERLARSARPFYVYGAGHVGRALVRALQGLPFDVRWIDPQSARFPDPLPGDVVAHATGDPAAVAAAAPAGSYHAVMTYSHQMDFDICLALLRGDLFGYPGLIGSTIKRARFSERLREQGIAEAALARLVCPIGAPGVIGKQPAVIAIAVAAQAIAELRKAE